MKLNRKGFAITGVLYGLLILFVMLVGSYLAILTSKKNRLDTITEEIDKKYNLQCEKNIETSSLNTQPFKAEYTGKYIFEFSGNRKCSFYAASGTVIQKDDLSFIEANCNSFILDNITAITVYYNGGEDCE